MGAMTVHRKGSVAPSSEKLARADRGTKPARSASDRTPRRLQLPLLKIAAFRLAKHKGRLITVSNYSVLETDVEPLLVWLTPLPFYTMLDIWDEAQSGRKVLHLELWNDGRIEVGGFRRGDWEAFLLSQARRLLT